MPTNRIILWRWAKPSKTFKPKPHPLYKHLKFSSHNKTVRAGLNPIDWAWMRSEGKVLHKIVLNKQQAELCVVAEQEFRPTEKELDEFIERKGIFLTGSRRVFAEDNYEKSFVPLLEYSGGYNLPEVLIPFCVKAKVVYWSKILILFLKLKNWMLASLSDEWT